ncbi:hypothetical protein [Sporomusa sp. GT1]|nr:hypothetical protein [Sporomusa sp. GT1]
MQQLETVIRQAVFVLILFSSQHNIDVKILDKNVFPRLTLRGLGA